MTDTRTALVIGGGVAGPVAAMALHLVMPVAMKRLAKPERMAWQFDYRIDRDAPVGESSRREVAHA